MEEDIDGDDDEEVRSFSFFIYFLGFSLFFGCWFLRPRGCTLGLCRSLRSRGRTRCGCRLGQIHWCEVADSLLQPSMVW